jgi:hypothetical protein
MFFVRAAALASLFCCPVYFFFVSVPLFYPVLFLFFLSFFFFFFSFLFSFSFLSLYLGPRKIGVGEGDKLFFDRVRALVVVLESLFEKSAEIQTGFGDDVIRIKQILVPNLW